ncbi:unnamed protein product [Arctia plantaginis]|uniref:Peptidase S1 domain-containing protein n=1 Tax=Arctia plantaginis TaxID=874455 RepID=A0A8S1ACD8_ARCPL|nr:unnamed protein product [Arctia plantaginis]
MLRCFLSPPSPDSGGGGVRLGGAREARDASDAEDLSISAVSIASLSPGADSRIVGGSPTTIENFPYAVQCETGARSVIIGGDSNAKCAWWGSPVTDRRGEELRGALEDLGLCLLNRGETPTFDAIRGGVRYSSYVDITAVSSDLFGLVDDWRVREDLTNSDHNGISFTLRTRRINKNHIRQTTRVYFTKKANWVQFREKLGQILNRENLTIDHIKNLLTDSDLDRTISKFNKIIAEACALSIPPVKRRDVVAVPWWSEGLAVLKREVATRKGRIRCAAPVRRQRVVGEYLEAKERYETEVKHAQTRSWVAFCERQDGESVWGGIYRVINRTSKRDEDQPLVVNNIELDARGSARLMAETFYPEDSEEDDSEEHRKLLRFKDSVQSASIPFQGETLADNSMVVAVGWGTTVIGGGVSNVLNQVSIRTVNQALCRERYAELSNFTGLLLAVTDNMFCAGLLDIGGADTCQGDSGGPLTYNGVIVGITSWGASCAHPTYPGVYTEVSKYANWINETLTKYNGSARDQAAGIIAVLMPLVFLTSVVNEIH